MTDWLHAFEEGYPTAEELEGSVTINDDTPEDRAAIERFRAEPLTLLDTIDAIIDDTHPEGDGCPLCSALDDLREALEARERRERVDPDLASHLRQMLAILEGVERAGLLGSGDVEAIRLARLAATPDHTEGGEEREIDVERLAVALREADGVAWPVLWERKPENFDWIARQVAAKYSATPRPR